MKITMSAIGSRGDVQPFVSLGMGPKQVAHEVTICKSDRFSLRSLDS